MSQLLIDLIPILIFFLAYKFYNIFVATGCLMAGTMLQLLYMKWAKRRIENMHWFTLALVMVMGSLTLFFHDEAFIKWKPTIIYWAFMLAFMVTPMFGKQNLVQHMLGSKLSLETPAWSILNRCFIAFFSIMGALNLWVFKTYSTNIWVNYKLFGTFGLTVLFTLIISIVIMKHREENHVKTP